MIEMIVMIAAGFAILYWASWVSHKGTDSPEAPECRKGHDEA